jgi:hypothetical protein
MGGGSAPPQDPNIGIAAREQAALGRDYLDYMKEAGAVTRAWAEEDRDRWSTVFKPIEDQFVAKAANWDTPARRTERRQSAEADVLAGISGAQEAEKRRLAAMGVSPDSGRAIAVGNANNVREGLARAGARNLSDRAVEQEGLQMEQAAVNLGKGYAINPATSMGMSGNMVGSGFQGAMQGQGEMIDALQGQQNYQMQVWQQNQNSAAAMWGGIGSVLGIMLSSKDYKTDRQAPSESPLEQVKEMPVQEYRYKDGIADGGAEQHIGPMAEDFQAATGRGDGRAISVQDAIGTTMGAVQELASKVEQLEQSISRRIQPPAEMAA